MAKKEIKARKAGDKTIYSNLIIRQPQRKTSDVALWRNALRSADAGRIVTLFDLYQDLLIDTILSEAYSKRIEAITNAELIFQDTKGKLVPEMVDIMDTLDWEVLITQILETKFWGRSGVEFDFRNGFEVNALPKKHISLETKSILINENDPTGIDYTSDDLLLVLGQPRDFGIFLRTAPYAIWKRGGFGDYAQWLEIFGMPQRVGKYSSYDPESRKLLEEALEKAGSAPWLVVPKESDIETVNNTGSGSSGNSFNDFRKACNEELLITVLGQTLTTLQGERGARSLGEVHKQVEEGKNKADMRFVEKVLNTYVRPVFESQRLPVAGGKFVFPGVAESITVDEIVSLSKVIPIPVSFIREKYGIPQAEEDEAIAGEITVQKEEEPKEKEPESTEDIKNDDRGLFLKLFDRFFVSAPTKRSGALQNWTRKLKRLTTGRIDLADDYSIDINRLIEEAVREVYGSRGEELLDEKLFEITNNALQHGIDASLDEIEHSDADFVNRFRENTAVFAAFKNHQQTREIAALLYDEDGKLQPFYKFKRQALMISEKYNVQWLQTEYNTAVRSARIATNLKKWEKTLRLYPNLEYMETNASHPRKSHLLYVGTILPFHHEWWDTHMPPSDWNCDCSVRPTDKDVTPVPPDYGGINPEFTNNPAKSTEFINTKETPYYKHTPEDLREEITAEAKRLQKEYKEAIKETYKGKKGGYLEIVKQQGQERQKNIATYKIMADNGGKYTLLRPSKVEGISSPDAFNNTAGYFSDAKHPVTDIGKNAIQASIRDASRQGVDEVVIRLEKDYSNRALYNGMKAAFHGRRGGNLKTVILIRKGKDPVTFSVDAIKRYFHK